MRQGILTRKEAVKRAKHMASSYSRTGRVKVTKVRGQNRYKYIFPILGSKGTCSGYGYGTIRPTGTSGSQIDKEHANLIRGRKRRKRKKR